ncbi:MAG: DNA cytosine methyltransferase [Alphaproteobacteria bacterium]|nr:DNA cytosine methyltransferase [Alphaproteobacteria bacterium]
MTNVRTGPRVLELYAGIGGVAASGANVVAAIDHDEAAHRTYTASWAHPAHRLNLVSVRAERLAAFEADVWWMSPPCQPFTVRGARRDLDDRRCESLVHLLDVVRVVRPRALILENVPGFEGSQAHAAVREALDGYALHERDWCPSALGVPMERRRFYLVATAEPVEPTIPVLPLRPLAGFLDARPDPAMALDAGFLDRFGDALHVVDADDPRAVSACITGAYGRSPVYAGSYLRRDGGLYRFSPAEIARLMGFPAHLALPTDVRRATKLLGNSLSVDVVRWLLGEIGALGRRPTPGAPLR